MLSDTPPPIGPELTIRLPASERTRRMYEELRERICILVYPPGTQLSEARLAEEFGVSRTPIRSVLGMLEADGLVSTQHGVATKVREIELSILREDYTIRMELAVLAGQMGLIPATETCIEELQSIQSDLRRMLNEGASIPEYGMLNLRYHRVFLRRVRNAALRKMIDLMYFQTSRIWLSRLPITGWNSELIQFESQINQMVGLYRANDSVGIGLLQRHIIYTSMERLEYNI